ncbi:hypothetical protein Gohar_020211 [Gossypium harknessii]|uniref:RNase H type-1 domain-containing protein n=1 Tax=Gossypium harknessii TaxID=34285 RepID=A0A7J9HWZ5_9ROSI|nr:hypothetical protein [Gossypium harknessii]
MERVWQRVGSNSSYSLCGHDTNDILHMDKSNVRISSSSNTLSENWVHLFTDGAVDRGSGAASAGGVILDGMITSLSNGFNRVLIHTDNLEVGQALQDKFTKGFGHYNSQESPKDHEYGRALADSTFS